MMRATVSPRRINAFIGAPAMIACLLSSSPGLAQGTAVLTGTILDTATNEPSAGVAATVSSPAVQGEQLVLTGSVWFNATPGSWRGLARP